MGHELVERRVPAVGDADLVGERVAEDRRRRERHLERVASRGPGQETGFPDGRRVNRPEASHDLVDCEGHVLSPSVPKVHHVVGPEPFDGVIEGIEEHPPPEFAVGDHVEAGVDLPADRFVDRLVLERSER